jgi:DNA-binding transcriptional MerR regulator
MFRIGDFSRLGQVSIKTLHHYDEVGLLQPAQVDQYTGYRYYSAGQLERLNRIITLKTLGFTLDQIAEVLNDDLSSVQILGMLRLRKAELQQRIKDDHKRLNQVDAWLRQIEEEQTMPKFDVMVKTVKPQLVASIRQVVPNVDALAPFFGEIEEHIKSNGGSIAGPGMIIYNDTEYCEGEFDAEAAIPVSSKLPGTERIRIYEIPSVELAYLVYTGRYEDVREAHQALGTWIAEHGYQLAGANRVVFLQCGESEAAWVVEIQYTVKK